MPVQFRDASIQDLPAIVGIYNSTVAGRMVTADTDPVSVDSRLAWFHEHRSSDRPLWMISYKGDDIGWVSFQSFYGRPAYRETAEVSIYLHESYRGKGFGKEILTLAMNSCAALGIKTLLGYIFAHNEPSMKLFKKSGFTVWGHFPRVAKLDGIERDLVIVGKRINP